MSAVQMSIEVQPLCARCGTAMVFVMVRGYVPGERYSSITAFACEEPGCGCLYNIVHGYFEVPEGRISPMQGENNVRCPIDESPMYLAGIVPDGTRIYHCARAGCGGSSM
jgi:hypothetical protein